MGAGARWIQAGRPTITAHGSHRRSGLLRRDKYCVLTHISSCVCVLSVGFLLLLGVCLLYLPDPFVVEAPENITVTLLVWTHPFGRYHALPDCWELSRVSGCTLTDDPSTYPEADAVVIHHREIADGTPLPPEPRPNAQKWIWMNHESPTHSADLWRFEGVFNLTLSYRTDSDISLPYGYLIPRGLQSGFAHSLLGGASSSSSFIVRPRLVAWVVSHWSESQARVALYRQLRRYIHVDVFGRAGRPLTAGRDNVVRLLRRYRFYLALENSQHTDYITEKLWNAVRAGAVPVVLGPSRQNYERFLPPEAFIHVDDFPSVKELARYLLVLRDSPALMRQHLDWRRNYRLHQLAFWGEHYCKACKVVKSTRGQTNVVQDLEDWFQS